LAAEVVEVSQEPQQLQPAAPQEALLLSQRVASPEQPQAQMLDLVLLPEQLVEQVP
jgi:hypothetical protein